MIDSDSFIQALLSRTGVRAVIDLTNDALGNGEEPISIRDNGLMKAMEEIGKKFVTDEFAIPEMFIALRGMRSALDILKPQLITTSDIADPVRIVLGTVKGDLHHIGKTMVGMCLEGSGFDVVDIGVNVEADRFVHAVNEHGASVLGMSVLLTTSLLQMKNVIDALKSNGLGKRVKTIVGGAPVTEEFSRKIGADAYAPDCFSAVKKVKDLVY